MTKHIEGGSRHQGDARTADLSNWRESDEAFFKCLNNFAGDLRNLAHEWEQRLPLREVMLPEDYVRGRVCLALAVRKPRSRAMQLNGGVPVGLNVNRAKAHSLYCDVEGANTLDGENQKIVLLPIGKPIEDQKGAISVVIKISMSAQILKKFDGSGECFSYLSIFNGTFHSLSVVGDGQCDIAFINAASAVEPSPAVIQRPAKVADCIASKQGNFIGDDAAIDAILHDAGLTLTFYQGKISVVFDKGVMDGLEVIDLLIGPLNF